MVHVIHRAILPSLLLFVGVGMVVYAAASRRLPIWEEALVQETVTEEREIEIPAGPPPMLPGPGGFPPDGMLGPAPMPLLPPIKEKVLVDVVRSRETQRKVEEPEYVVVREITMGRIFLASPGKLMRSYRRPEAGWDPADLPPPPSRCPT